MVDRRRMNYVPCNFMDGQDQLKTMIYSISVVTIVRIAALATIAGSAIPLALASDGMQSLSNAMVGEEFDYTVKRGENLSLIGARFGESPILIAHENGLSPSAVLKEGTTIKINNQHIVPASDLTDGILVNIPQRTLFHFRAASVEAAYPVGLGRRDWPTPTGRFRVVDLQKDKEWVVPDSIQEEMLREGKEVLSHVSPGPDNPLGKHWIGLSIGSIGIHGTIAPSSVYHFRSHGCIRLHPDDVERLFGNVKIGERGVIVYQPVLVARVDEHLFLEVNADAYKRGIALLEVVRRIAEQEGLVASIDWIRVDAVIEEKAGIAREIGKF